MKTNDIERYINHEMEGDELFQFELELKRNIELQEEVQNMQSIIEKFKLVGLSDKIIKAQQKNKELQHYKLYGIIAVVCLIILIIFYRQLSPKNILNLNSKDIKLQNDTTNVINNPLEIESETKREKPTKSKENIPKDKKIQIPIAQNSPNSNKNDGKEIAMNFYVVPGELEYVRGSNVESIIDSAKLSFNNEEYSNALAYLNKLGNNNQNDYFKAHLYFNNGQFDYAINYFEKSLANEKSIKKREEIEWYLILSNLACGIKCENKLNNLVSKVLSNPMHGYYNRVINLQKKLKQK